MIKVFLAEDEWMIREGIKKRINWEDNGFVLTGEAEDGEKAYAMIQEIRPDILITDIIMPFMNGLELSEMVLREFPNTKIIIVSGYDNTAYAKRAIDLGVTEYLLKPMTSARLLNSLLTVKKMIQKEQDPKKQPIVHQEKSKEEAGAGGNITEKEQGANRFHKKEIIEFLQNGSRNDIEFFVEKYIQNMGQTNMSSLMFRQYVILDINLAVMDYLQRLGYRPEDVKKKFLEFEDMAFFTSSLESTKKYLVRCFAACMELGDMKG